MCRSVLPPSLAPSPFPPSLKGGKGMDKEGTGGRGRGKEGREGRGKGAEGRSPVASSPRSATDCVCSYRRTTRYARRTAQSSWCRGRSSRRKKVSRWLRLDWTRGPVDAALNSAEMPRCTGTVARCAFVIYYTAR